MGIGHIAINAVPMATNQGFKNFVPKPGLLYAKFLYWWLDWNRSYLISLGNGATFKEVSKTVVSLNTGHKDAHSALADASMSWRVLKAQL